MKLWIDDVRTPPCDGWIHCRTVNETKAAVNFYERQRSDDSIIIDLDHDLGCKKTGYDVAKWIVASGYTNIRFHIHSANPVGRKNISELLTHYGYEEV